jgi:hypothetical protein
MWISLYLFLLELSLSKYTNETPLRDSQRISDLRKLRAYAERIHESMQPRASACGIMWTLSSLNGTNTNYEIMARFGYGESKYRLLSALNEVVVSAGRVRSALAHYSVVPPICGNIVELGLSIDRDMVIAFESEMISYIECSFNRVMYFDQYINDTDSINFRKFDTRDLFIRLAARPNAMKLISFLLSPYK